MNDRAIRTTLCSVVFADLVGYSTRSAAEQIAAKNRFNACLARSLTDIAPQDRIVLDTGDGAALGLLGDPEDALFVSLSLRGEMSGGELRIGINLGPVKLVDDVNGHASMLGDGINAAQRIMGFADPGQIVVSRSYYDVVSRLSEEYATLFSHGGARTDKHLREHDIYLVGESADAYSNALTGLRRRAVQAPPPLTQAVPHVVQSPTALIAEDEPVLRAELLDLLAKVWPELDIVAEAKDGLQAIHMLDTHKPDILFLDIHMPGLTGLEVARAASGRAHIIFVTAYDEHALAAFDEGAIDYVMKPVNAARLVAACQRIQKRLGTAPAAVDVALSQLSGRGAPAAVDVALFQLSGRGAPAKGFLRWINVSRGAQLILVTVEEVCFFREEEKQTSVVTPKLQGVMRKPLRAVRDELDPDVFWPVDPSTIVNVNAISSIESDLGGAVTLTLKAHQETLVANAPYADRFRQM
ncbi:MAG: response regulator [Betaproteobacteria bacterium]